MLARVVCLRHGQLEASLAGVRGTTRWEEDAPFLEARLDLNSFQVPRLSGWIAAQLLRVSVIHWLVLGSELLVPFPREPGEALVIPTLPKATLGREPKKQFMEKTETEYKFFLTKKI